MTDYRSDMNNDDPFPIGDDELLGAALRTEVPERRDGYWAAIDQQLASPARLDTDVETSTTAPGVDISAATQADTGMLRRLRTWPVLVAAAALVLIAGLLAVPLLPSNGERVDTGFADGDEPVALEDLPGPRQNRDHWHAIYGVWDCTASGGGGAWLPVFESNEDAVGIHSHGAGLIYIHPFGEESAGRNATFSHFADAMNFTITNDTVTLEDGTTLAEGAVCNGEPAVLEMYRWQDARALEEDPSLPPRIITEDFGSERFYNDFEVWTVALTPAGADVPLPPQARFDELANWWFQGETTSNVARPTPISENEVYSVPPAGTSVYLGVVATASDADPAIEAVANSPAPGVPIQGEPKLGSGIQLSAIAPDVRLQVEILTYIVENAPGLVQVFSCWEVTDWGGGCLRADDPQLGFPRLYSNTGGDIETVTLLDAPQGARWLSLTLDDGHVVLSDAVEGVSWAAWRVERGDWATAELLDIDHNILWSGSNEA